MNAMISCAHLHQKIGALDARMNNVEKCIEKIDANVETLVATANMGRGAWWGATKFGGIVILFLGLFSWAWGHLRLFFDRWHV